MIQVNSAETYRALSDLARRYQFRSRDEICCYGLTVSQCYAMEFLADAAHVTMTQLATQLGLDLSSTTRLVDQLVKKKLVSRRKIDEDGRIRELELTDAAKRITSRIQQDLIALLDRALADMPENVLKSLPEALRRITRALNECCEVPEVIPVESIRRVAR